MATAKELDKEASELNLKWRHEQDKCRELEAENAALREALGAADNKILNFLATLSFVEPSNKVFTDDLTEARALIEAALKGV